MSESVAYMPWHKEENENKESNKENKEKEEIPPSSSEKKIKKERDIGPILGAQNVGVLRLL